MDYKEIARQVGKIDEQIGLLRQQRAQVLRQDEEYASYLDAFEEAGCPGGEPLSIVHFHNLNTRLCELSDSILNLPDDEFETGWRRTRNEIMRLEKQLLA